MANAPSGPSQDEVASKSGVARTELLKLEIYLVYTPGSPLLSPPISNDANIFNQRPSSFNLSTLPSQLSIS